MSSFKDLTGQTFNNLSVLGPVRQPNKKGIYWLCRCVCGKEIQCCKSNLLRNQGCGCIRRVRGPKNKSVSIGQRFGNVVVTDISKPDNSTEYAFYYKCDCGKESKVRGEEILTKKSCGCMTPRIRDMSEVTTGEIRHSFWNVIKKTSHSEKFRFYYNNRIWMGTVFKAE